MQEALRTQKVQRYLPVASGEDKGQTQRRMWQHSPAGALYR